MDKVSIVVPVYNMGDKIETCVQSLLCQSYTNIEIILVDDGSKDDSFKHCQNLARKDNRVVTYHTENRGSGPARNFGIEHATGTYIYFPDADDYLEPDAISIMVDAMDNGKHDLVVFGFKNVNQNHEVVKVKEYNELIKNGDDIRKNYKNYMTTMSIWGIQGAPWNKLFKLNTIKRNKLSYPSLRRHQDEGFIGRYMCWAHSVHFIKNVLYTYYINDLQKEWEKYPVDYIEAVIGLLEVRKETILTWNKSDHETHDLIKKEYICNCIKAMELTFSPKTGLKNIYEQKKWINDLISKTDIEKYDLPSSFNMKYQRIVLHYIKQHKLNLLCAILKSKILIEKYFRGIIKKRQYAKAN